MERSIQREVSRRLVSRFYLQLAVYTLIVIAASAAGYIYCSRRVWHIGDFWYPLIHLLHERWAMFFVLCLFVGCMIITHINFRRIARSLRQVVEAVDSIYREQQTAVGLPANLREVENRLNQIRMDMLSNRQAAREAEQRRNDMVMYMAHDLKTPLTSVIGYLTLLRDEPEISGEVRDKYMEIALRKSLRLEELINGFFEIARFNFSHMTLECSDVNMSVMVEQMLYEFQPLFDRKGLYFTLQAERDVHVICDVEKMERVFDNLLKNVVNYSYENTEIAVQLEKNGSDGMRLTVENHGRTIPREKLQHLFDQFFRMDSSRSSETGGSGLGLAVVREIVNLHRGTVVCESENEIIRFIITI